MLMSIPRRCLRNVSVEWMLTSAAVVALVWVFISRQDLRQVAVQQIDDQHTQAAVVTPGVLVTSSRSVTSAAQSIERSRSTNPPTPEVFSLFKAPEETPAEMVLIRKYLKTEESRCRQNMRKKMRRKASYHNNASVTHQWCPCLPQDLNGRVFVSRMDDMSWEAITEAVGSDFILGGEWKPGHCQSHTRMAIIIPCRDRDSHLRILLKHLIPILKRQLIHFRIFVIDQSHPTIFNKAAIMNAGFLEAEKRFNFDCILFHDVDHLIEDDRALLNCGPQPHHYAASIDSWGYRLLYGSVFGGVLTLTPEMFRRVNGFSNIYFGWGGEDDDMGYRIRRYWRVFRPPLAICRYTTLRHVRDSGNPRNQIRHRLMQQENEKYDKTSKIDNGVSTLKYTITNTKTKHFYTWIQASINETFLPYPPMPPAGKYQKVVGLCRLTDSILETSDVSISSCRLQCDTLRRQPCFGFSYQPETTPKCSILRSPCPLERTGGALTYVKS